MGHTNLPNLTTPADQLRVDGGGVLGQRESFGVAGLNAKPNTASATPIDEPDSPAIAKGTVFPFMRAYGCLGSKQESTN